MIGKTLSHTFKYGVLRSIGKPLYETFVFAELAWVRFKDRNVRFSPTPLTDEKLTAIVKTFERPETLRRLIDSIERFYPRLRIIVADDSREPYEDARVDVIRLPFDSGVSAGRQAALDAVKTPYVLLLDDDFVFYAETKIEEQLTLLEKEPRIDLIGGEVVNLPSFKANDYRNAALHPTDAESILPAGSEIAGLTVYDKVPNFYVARTESVREVGWDKRIKRIDHADFFTRAKGRIVSVYNPEMKILHAQTPYNDDYMRHKRDVTADRLVIRMKYYASLP
jgi:glycosyltransferase involved in cell wall biosynthesis